MSLLKLTKDANAPIEPIQKAIAAGGNVNEVGRQGQTPLTQTVLSNRSDIVSLLLENGADPNLVKGMFASPPLNLAVVNSSTEIVKALLTKGANPNTALKNAVMTKKEPVEKMKLLIQHGADINTPSEDSAGKTALIYAAENGTVDMVKLLLENGADASIRDDYDRTALDAARNPEVRELLSAPVKRAVGEVAMKKGLSPGIQQNIRSMIGLSRRTHKKKRTKKRKTRKAF
jgi:ankyrin repeat protein